MKGIRSTLVIIAVLLMTYCGGGGHSVTPPPAQIMVSVSPSAVSVTAGQTQQFTATVTNSSNTSVTWTVVGTGCTGLTCGTISAAGLYTAPSPIPASASVTVTATSVADSTKSATATVTHVPIAVTVSPGTTTLNGAETKQFTATVTGHTNKSVTWSVSGGGSIDSNGMYTAPTCVPAQSSVTVTATSQFDTTKSGSVTITLNPLSIAISPTSKTLYGGATQQFTATITNHSNTAVTWSASGGGTVSTSGLYTAPAVVSAQSSVTLIATSQIDPTKSASATITLIPVAVSVSPSSATLFVGEQKQFQSTVTGSNNTAVTWSVSGPTCVGAACGTIDQAGLYTAPATITPVAVTKTIHGASGPWVYDSTHNTSFPYGVYPGPPIIFDSEDGFAVQAGARFTIEYVSGLWCSGTYVSTSTCRDANGYLDYPTNDTMALNVYAPSKYMDHSQYPVYAVELAGVFADDSGNIVGTPFAVGNGPVTVTAPSGATRLQLGASNWDYYNARDFYSPLQAKVTQAAEVVVVTATSQADPAKSASADVRVSGDHNAKLNGSYAFLFQGFNASGAMTAMVGSFLADGNGNITQALGDINYLGGSLFTQQSFTGSYQMGGDDRGVLNFGAGSSMGSPSFRFALNQDGSKAYAVEIDTSGSHLAGYFYKQDTSSFTVSSVTGDFAFGFAGASTGNERNAAVGRMHLENVGTITGGEMFTTDPNNYSFTGSYAYSSATGINRGRGTMTINISGLGAFPAGFYVVNGSKLLFMLEGQTGLDIPLLYGELRRQSGTFTASSLSGAAVFYYTGVDQLLHRTNTVVGRLTANSPNLGGEYAASMTGTPVTQQQFLGTYTVNPSGRVIMETNLGQMFAYLTGPNTGFLLQATGYGLGMIEPQVLPSGGVSLSNIAGRSICAGTEVPLPQSGEFACAMTFDSSGNWTGIADISSAMYGNATDVAESGVIVLASGSSGYITNTVTYPATYHHVLYAITPEKLVIIDTDPSSANEGVLWQAVGFWER